METYSNEEIYKLIFIHVVGESFNGLKKYQFLFSKTTNFSYKDWEKTPAISNVTIPVRETINLLEVELKSDFWLLKDSADFAYIDAQNIGIPIAVEMKNRGQSEIPKVAFMYGENKQSVKDKLLKNFKIIL